MAPDGLVPSRAPTDGVGEVLPAPCRAWDLPEAVTIADAARLLGVSYRTVQKLIKNRHLRPFYLPDSARPRIPIDQINAIRRVTDPAQVKRAQSPLDRYNVQRQQAARARKRKTRGTRTRRR